MVKTEENTVKSRVYQSLPCGINEEFSISRLDYPLQTVDPSKIKGLFSLDHLPTVDREEVYHAIQKRKAAAGSEKSRRT